MSTEDLSRDLNEMRSDIGDIRTSVGKIADAMTRLAILEERGATNAQLAEKLIERMDRVEARQHKQELEQVVNKNDEQRIAKTEDQIHTLQEAEISRAATLRTATYFARTGWTVFGGMLIYLVMHLFTESPIPIAIPGVH